MVSAFSRSIFIRTCQHQQYIKTVLTSPFFFIGTKLRDDLPNDIQQVDNVFEFKREMCKLYSKYEDLLKPNGR